MMKQKKSDPLDPFLGTRLKQLRIRRGLSMAQLGEIIEVTPQQISRYESGQHRITAPALFRLARALNMPISWFFDDFQEDQDELRRIRNILHESRTDYTPTSDNDREMTLVSLWQSLPKENQRQQIIRLLEAFI